MNKSIEERIVKCDRLDGGWFPAAWEADFADDLCPHFLMAHPKGARL